MTSEIRLSPLEGTVSLEEVAELAKALEGARGGAEDGVDVSALRDAAGRASRARIVSATHSPVQMAMAIRVLHCACR